MNFYDIKNAVLEGSAEIEVLRRRNEVLEAKVDTLDLVAALLFAQPRSSGRGMAPDIAWKMRGLADAIGVEKAK